MSPWEISLLGFFLATLLLAFLEKKTAKQKRTLTFLVLIAFAGALSLARARHWFISSLSWVAVGASLTAVLRLPKLSAQKIEVSRIALWNEALGSVLFCIGAFLLYATVESPSTWGLAFCLVGIFTRLGVVPFESLLFHRAQSGSLTMVGLSTVLVPFCTTAYCWQWVGSSFVGALAPFSSFIEMMGLLTAWVGAIGMLVRSEVRQFVAYACISQAGWLLLCLANQSSFGIEAAWFNLNLMHSAGLLLLLSAYSILIRRTERDNARVLRGVFHKSAPLAFVLLSAFALIGSLPPSGTYAFRVALLGKLLANGLPSVAILAAFSLLPCTYACLRLTIRLFGRAEAEEDTEFPARIPMVVLVFLALVSWVVGLMPAIGWLG